MAFWDHLALPVALGSALRDWRSPLVALAATVLAAGAGRLLRQPLLTRASVGLGAALGVWQLSDFAWVPPGALGRLLPMAVAALAGALALGVNRVVIALHAIGGGWWLAGAPRAFAGFRPWAPPWSAVALAALALAVGMIFMTRKSEAARVIVASIALACAFSADHAAWGWVLAALCPAAASVGARAGGGGAVVAPVALFLPAVVVGWALATGPTHPPTVIATALAPVLAAVLLDRLRPRLGLAAVPVAVAGTACLAWIVVRAGAIP